MQSEVYNATNTATYSNVSSTAKSALQAAQTQDLLIAAKKEIHTLVTTGKITVLDNMHLLLGKVNSQPNPQKDGSAVATSYHNFDSLQIQAKKLS